jgi:hypothetical protein
VVEIIFLMLVLKLPILYLIGVVWWAVRAEPPPPEPALLPATPEHEPPFRDPRPRRRGPRRGGPTRRDQSARRAARISAR